MFLALNLLMAMKSLDVFPIVFKDHYQFDWETISPRVLSLFDEVDEYAALEVNGKTTVGLNIYEDKRPHLWPEFTDYIQWLQPRVESIWSRWGLRPMKKYCTGSWFNLHTRDCHTLEHYHHGVHLVITSYLQCPKNSGFIQLRSPHELHKLGEPLASPDAGIWEEVPVETNDILIFPGWIKHKTGVSTTDDPRIVFTMNVSGEEYA